MTAPTHQGAIITGGASGLGLAIVNDLLSKGWRVVVADVNKTGKSVVDELLAKYGNDAALWAEVDISEWDQQATMFEKCACLRNIYGIIRVRVDVRFQRSHGVRTSPFSPPTLASPQTSPHPMASPWTLCTARSNHSI